MCVSEAQTAMRICGCVVVSCGPLRSLFLPVLLVCVLLMRGHLRRRLESRVGEADSPVGCGGLAWADGGGRAGLTDVLYEQPSQTAPCSHQIIE